MRLEFPPRNHGTDSSGIAQAGRAIRTPREQSPIAYVELNAARTTFFGGVGVHAIGLVEDSIITGPLLAARRQIGCLRFSYVGEGSRPPPAFHAVPPSPPPLFQSMRYGTASYARLADSGPAAFRNGASDEAEIGVFHDLFEGRRATALTARLAEHVPIGFDAGIIFAT